MADHELEYEFLAPPRIVFGWGRRAQVGQLARALGRRAFIVCGSRTLAAHGYLEELQASLSREQIESIHLADIAHEPEVEDVDQAVAALRRHTVREGDFVLALGGGSAIDLGKAVAALANQEGSDTVKDYLEGVGRGLKIARLPLPVLAMPTTAGTGSEATKNSVISSHTPPFKKSLRSDLMIPRAVLIDPELTVSSPASVTAQTGMDAITQLIESYISRKSRPLPQALARDGLRRALPAIAEAVHNGSSRAAREAMSHAALLSGMALANSGLGMAHGVAAALGVHCQVPHGLACAVMLPIALEVNRQASEAPLAELAEAVGMRADSSAAAADAFILRIRGLCEELGIPGRLSQIGVRREQIDELVRGSRGNSMDGNPRQLSDEELTRSLEAAL